MSLRSHLPRIRQRMVIATQRITEATAKAVFQSAVRRVPVDEGDLSGSIKIVRSGEPGVRSVQVGGLPGPNKFVHYAAQVEYGTEQRRATPYFTPAAADGAATMIATGSAILADILTP